MHYGNHATFIFINFLRSWILSLSPIWHAVLVLANPQGLICPVNRLDWSRLRNGNRRVVGQPWQKGETLLASIGQGYILATPLQLAVMTSRLVNGGRSVVPFLAFEPGTHATTPPVDDLGSLGVSQSSLEVMARSMSAVVNQPSGTAFSSRIHRSDYMMGGKTGTSQVRRISEWERRHGVIKNENLPRIKRDHALFVGYAPLDKPRYACAVIVEHGGSGAKVAAPIARDILIELQKRMSEHPSVGRSTGAHSRAG